MFIAKLSAQNSPDVPAPRLFGAGASGLNLKVNLTSTNMPALRASIFQLLIRITNQNLSICNQII
jgi:hypothetical protein